MGDTMAPLSPRLGSTYSYWIPLVSLASKGPSPVQLLEKVAPSFAALNLLSPSILPPTTFCCPSLES